VAIKLRGVVWMIKSRPTPFRADTMTVHRRANTRRAKETKELSRGRDLELDREYRKYLELDRGDLP